MTYKETEKSVAEFFKGTPFKKWYSIAFDGISYRSGTTVTREVYISFERRKVKFTFIAPLSRDTTSEWSFKTPDELKSLLPKDEQDFDKKLWENA